jgi:hypothetical protein
MPVKMAAFGNAGRYMESRLHVEAARVFKVGIVAAELLLIVRIIDIFRVCFAVSRRR